MRVLERFHKHNQTPCLQAGTLLSTEDPSVRDLRPRMCLPFKQLFLEFAVIPQREEKQTGNTNIGNWRNQASWERKTTDTARSLTQQLPTHKQEENGRLE